MPENITKARIADAAIKYAAAREAYNTAEMDAELGRIEQGEVDAAYESMDEAEQDMLNLIGEWNRLQAVLNRNR